MQASSSQTAEDHEPSQDVSEIARVFEHSIRLNKDMDAQRTNFEEEELYHDAEEEKYEETEHEEQETEDEKQETEDEEFSFTFNGENGSPIAAEDAFVNGQIKPMFPLFNQELLMQERYFEENLSENPKVKKVLFKDSSENDEISGPYCEWNGKPAASATEKEGWKKSNSTGFSKLWRLKDLVNRSNSDGRDAFVFLNNQPTTSSNNRKTVASGGVGGGSKETGEGIKGGKKKTTSFSAHEIYLKNKAKDNENERRKSYMPYKPEMFGFFTNVNGGISKNVHPY